ncbi:COX15/CtaA family protein [Corynebacterium mastitidis]|uniref:COX15/CtaA family protein n=1 Tax=Corynebacterium mastitidis TaxID=161890 RepID=UPI00254FBAFF|nr:COX15/CtaA family protein [Corynebacterium mastitidis]MDK8449875.1 COX15/CtaA family protein [Corynebacterium mastitidis]
MLTNLKKTPSPRTQRLLALILLLCQGGITVTGSIVRVTGSGLGCNTWPQCHEGSLVPVRGAAPLVHQAIEFGNRLLTFVLVAAVVAVFVGLVRAERRAELIAYALVSGLGVVLQAVIGGISVKLDLQWWSVALHFLPSMVLVWVAALLYVRVAEPDDVSPVRAYPRAARWSAVVAACAMAVVLVTGTMVTGAGPHAGDAEAGMSGRLDVDIDVMAHVHGYLMYAYLLCTFVTVVLLTRYRAPERARRAGLVLLGMIVVQAAIGIAQYRLGVPRWSVPMHIAMSSVVVACTAFLYAHGLVRQEAPHRRP